MNNALLVIVLGILSTTQLHLAKAMQRQGIEVFDRIQARLKRTGEELPGDARKPAIYVVGVALNQLEFIYPILAQPYGPPALFTSMFGMGLVALMFYAALVMKESIGRLEVIGSGLIVAGTLTVGVENLWRQDYDRFQMDVGAMLTALLIVLGLAILAMVLVYKRGSMNQIGLAFGLSAGALGGLDPFLKGVGQNLGGTPGFLPRTVPGMILFLSSFVIGFLAFATTQVGFARKARASVLVPAYDSAYVVLPVLLQLLLLPSYRLYWTTVLGIGSIVLGIMLMRAFGR
jgi:uncharacterized membrane protein